MNNNLSRLKIFGWTLFDFGNTAFSVMIVTFCYPLFYKIIVTGNSENGDLYWGLVVSISMLITAIISPILGAASDYSQNRKKILFIFTFFSVLCTALLSLVGPGMIIIGAFLFIIANIGFEGGIVFYDSFLPDITSKKNYGRVSGYGFAMGYLGALAILLLNYNYLKNGINIENLSNLHTSFITTAAFFFIFSLPVFFVVPEKQTFFSKNFYFYIKNGISRVKSTIKNLKSYRNVAKFLISFFLYNDGILTIISFASIIAEKTFNFTVEELVVFFISVQSSAILGSIIFGIITDKIGAKKTLIITLILWLLVVFISFFSYSKLEFYAIGFSVGILLGASQSSSRSLMAILTPYSHKAEFFGFYDGFCGKASAIIGPLLFGLTSSLFHNQRNAILSIGLFFLVGLLVLLKVKEE
ncbi:MAG TPA: MFS transporter [Ignavibacteria bacterium]